MKNSIKSLLKAALLYITLILAALLITFPIINSAHGRVTQDLGGTWQIDTSTDEQIEYPYLQLIKSYNPFKDTKLDMLSGRVDSLKCGQSINVNKMKAETRVDLLMEKVREITNNKYTVTVAVFVCYLDWYVIYLHDENAFASRPIYDKVWESIKPND